MIVVYIGSPNTRFMFILRAPAYIHLWTLVIPPYGRHVPTVCVDIHHCIFAIVRAIKTMSVALETSYNEQWSELIVVCATHKPSMDTAEGQLYRNSQHCNNCSIDTITQLPIPVQAVNDHSTNYWSPPIQATEDNNSTSCLVVSTKTFLCIRQIVC